MRKATIGEVASRAGVSVSTVSHVINKTRAVTPQTAKRVEDAIAELGYFPSGVAQALRADRTRTIGMIVASSTNPFFAEVIHGVEAGCTDKGFSLILANSGDELDKLVSHLRVLITKRIDGLIVMTTNSSPDFFDHLAAVRRIPVVAIDAHQGGVLCVINDDSRYGAKLVADLLVARGLQHVCCIGGPEGHPRSEERVGSFKQGLAAAGQAIDARQVVRRPDQTVADGYAGMVELIQRGVPMDATFACNDLLAIGAICALHEHGRRVPEDVSIVGYDDIEIAAFTTPPLTTVRQPSHAIGVMAAHILIDYLESGDRPPESVILKPELVDRKSVRPGLHEGW